jgi:hypothetical protein
MKKLTFLLLTFLCLQISAQTKPAETSEAFWNSLKKLCGKAYAGEVRLAPENDTTFKDKKLVMHVRACTENEIRIPLVVGEDRSRTWVLTKTGNFIRLKHDHRHEDGKPDAVTNYGGTAASSGSATMQIFPADEETAKLLPAAVSNVWWIDLTGEHFTYNLRRLGSDRAYSLRFDLTKETEAPEAPWGWEEKKAVSSEQ